MLSLQLWLVAYSLLAVSWSYPRFREQIPNGDNVPHPCKPNYRWRGVGHENPRGGGPRNPFGLAFEKARFEWTPELCQEDSDGDGRTNGEELGDPLCHWKSGTLPARTNNITHPGVCDPYTSDYCQARNPFLKCELDSFEGCNVTKNPETRHLDLTFTKIQVPPTETNYFCMTFDLPIDQDYHIVATEPIIDNVNILHHILVYGCDKSTDMQIPTPQHCGMSFEKTCNSIIAGWSVGQSGTCLGDEVSFRIGRTGFQAVKFQIHYNNPTLAENYTDSSGLRIYYKPVLPGSQDLVVIRTGQMLLTIPPGQRSVEQVGVCPSACTRMIFSKPVHVVYASNHMHYRGKSMKIVVIRNGTEVKTLTNDTLYSYDVPVAYWYKPALELLPGDEVRTTCVYSSISTPHYVYYGESTDDEMCYGYVAVYPKEAVTVGATCAAFGSTNGCTITNKSPVGQCDWAAFINNKKLFSDVTKSCNLDGFCRPECRAVLKPLESHPCMKGEAFQWIVYSLQRSTPGLNFLARLNSCPVNPCGRN